MITLATLHEATPQEVFEQGIRHLWSQGEVCTISNDGVTACAYLRMKNGKRLKCIAGCFIADEEYHGGMEYKSWKDLVKLVYAPTWHCDLIDDMQNIHDVGLIDRYSGEVGTGLTLQTLWLKEAELLAQDYGLDTSFINGLTFGEGCDSLPS